MKGVVGLEMGCSQLRSCFEDARSSQNATGQTAVPSAGRHPGCMRDQLSLRNLPTHSDAKFSALSNKNFIEYSWHSGYLPPFWERDNTIGNHGEITLSHPPLPSQYRKEEKKPSERAGLQSSLIQEVRYRRICHMMLGSGWGVLDPGAGSSKLEKCTSFSGGGVLDVHTHFLPLMRLSL